MALIEDISSIRIKGGIFETETDLPIFKKDKQKPRFSLLYGKNGTGKSTISRAFRKLVGVNGKQIDSVEIIDEQNAAISITDELKKSIYVFNEDFIEDNIRIDGDGLNTIVVMGAVKDIDDKLKKIKPDYIKSVEVAKKEQEKYDQYMDHKNKMSPDYYLYEMQKALKGDANWAGRNASIFGKKTNSQVKKDTYTQFLNLTPTKKRDELIVEFDKLMKQFEDAKTGSKKIENSVPKLKKYIDIEETIVLLLGEKIEKPVLNEREKNLFSILQEENGNQRLNEIKKFFEVKEQKICPFCFQEVRQEYAEELSTSIEKILSKKVEEHQQKLQSQKVERYEIELMEFKGLSEYAVEKCEETLTKLNSVIDEINNLLEQKIGNVYDVITVKPFDLKRKYEDCTSELENLEKLRIEFNNQATDTTPLVNQLKEINNDIAFYDIVELHKTYQDKLNEKSSVEVALKKYVAERDSLKREIEDLEQKKKNAKIAMKAINDDLAYIFFSKERLKIKYMDEKYVLYSHGKPVEPSNVSVGERNAIGLCYFFNCIMENKDEAEVFKQSYLLIIDDPVSSFDMENRIGILSYLKYKLGQFILGNKDSRFLVMTHDLQTFYDTKHLMDEILTKLFETPNILPGKAVNYLREMELKNNTLDKTNLCSRSEYTALFEVVYDYGVCIEPVYSINIGNIMRKVMEAFGTFVYKKGMSELSTNEKIVTSLTEKDKIYFENLMYRLVLNTGSHMKEKAMTINDMKFFDYISDEDKQRTARDIICFMYKLNPLHVIAHLEKREGAEQMIKEWCRYIESCIL